MKFRLLPLLICIPMLHGLASAQPRGRAGDTAWGPRGAYQRNYDPKTVETFRGTVLSLDTLFLGRGGRGGLHLMVKRPADSISVHLGPLWYLENQETAFVRNDSLTIKGSRITFQGRPAVIAAEVIHGTDTLVLRDARGMPAWSGWRRRGGR